MRSTARFAWTMGRVALHVATASFLVALVFPWSSPVTRRRCVRWWSGRVLTLCRMQLRVIPPASGGAAFTRLLRPEGAGAMMVMNHVSWIDVFVLHSLRAARFVAKAEISHWPLLGYLTDRTGAIFIERHKRHAVREVNHRLAVMLREGALVGVFPEGGVSDGERLLPFHANLIQPAIDAAAPIVVAGLRYRDANGRPTTATYFAGEVTMLQSIVRIVRRGPLIAELHLIEVIDGGATTRHEVARRARMRIAEVLGFDDEDREAADGLSSVIVVPDEVGVSPARALAGRAPGTVLDPRDELL